MENPNSTENMTRPGVVWPNGSHTTKHAKTVMAMEIMFELKGPIISAHQPGMALPTTEAAFMMGSSWKAKVSLNPLARA